MGALTGEPAALQRALHLAMALAAAGELSVRQGDATACTPAHGMAAGAAPGEGPGQAEPGGEQAAGDGRMREPVSDPSGRLSGALRMESYRPPSLLWIISLGRGPLS